MSNVNSGDFFYHGLWPHSILLTSEHITGLSDKKAVLCEKI